MKRDLNDEHLRQEVTVTLPLGVVLRISGDAPIIGAAAAATNFGKLPTIGAEFEGGIYVGLSVENEKPVALVLLPGDESLKWEAAVAWAEKQGGVLPSRIDQLVLFKNAKAEFKDAWYWSGEQYAGGTGYAWYQGFSDGFQHDDREASAGRVRAVRRLPIQ